MKKSILFDLLMKFSPKEMKEFEEFIHSPFFNKNQSVSQLFDYIRKQYPAFNDKSVEKCFVYKEIFQGVKRHE